MNEENLVGQEQADRLVDALADIVGLLVANLPQNVRFDTVIYLIDYRRQLGEKLLEQQDSADRLAYKMLSLVTAKALDVMTEEQKK